jgi:hypothetical protein
MLASVVEGLSSCEVAHYYAALVDEKLSDKMLDLEGRVSANQTNGYFRLYYS